MRALAGCMMLIALVANAQDQPPSVKMPPALDRVLRDYETAWRAHDAAGLANLFSEDGFVLRSRHPPARGRDAIRTAYAKVGGPLLLRALDYSTSGNIGWIIGAYGQEPSKDMGKFVLALKKVKGRWLIASDIDNGNTPPPAPKPPGDQKLYDEISGLDAAMFDAFNAHDADKVKTLFAPELEFFHDTGGLLSRDQAIDGMRSNFEKNNGLRRDLVTGTLEVYPVKGYGAIETGSHRFCHQEDGKDDCGVFRFLHVWRNQNGTWQITRAVSYDH